MSAYPGVPEQGPPPGYAPNAPPPAGYGYGPPQPQGGYAPPPQMMQPQQQQQQQMTNVTIVNSNPGMVGCAHTSKSSHFTACGIIMCICFFPIGILCCLCMMETRCNNCGARF